MKTFLGVEMKFVSVVVVSELFLVSGLLMVGEMASIVALCDALIVVFMVDSRNSNKKHIN